MAMSNSSIEKGINKKIRVLVIDDSALVRQLLSEILSQDPMIEVVGVSGNVPTGTLGQHCYLTVHSHSHSVF